MDTHFRKFKELIRRLSRKSQHKRNLGGEIRSTGELVAHKLPPSLQINVNDSLTVSEEIMLHSSSGGSEGIRIANSEGQSVAADVTSKGIIDFSIKGKSRQGETGIIKVCEILIERLNQDGANWSRPIDLNIIDGRKEEGVDCESYDGNSILNIQVTRVERGIWRDLSNKGATSKNVDAQVLAESIKSAILTKSRAISRDQRKELILALDATETPNYAFELSVKLFRETYQSEIAALGFRGIWLVGPIVTMTHRLD
jgi:hypothetical protein